MTRIAQAMAILGGIVLSLLILLICFSIVTRELSSVFHRDILAALPPGILTELATWAKNNFELIENGMPFVIFAFLPLAQITSSHATVDVFTTRFPAPVLRFMRALTEIVFAGVLVLFAEKLYEGMNAKMRYGEITYLIQFPVWWAYALALVAAVVAAVVAVYMALLRVYEMATGHRIALDDGEAGH